MAAVPSGYVAGSPINGVIPLYDASSGLIAGRIKDGKTTILSSKSPQSDISAQAIFPHEIGVSGQGSSGQGGTPPGGMSPSYLSTPWATNSGTATSASAGTASGTNSTTSAGGSMSWTDVANQLGLSQSDINAFTQQGWDPGSFLSKYQSTGQIPTGGPKAPETVALGQMAGIDPASETLRTAVANSYLTPLQQAGTPTAAQFQSYLDLSKKIDPASAAARQTLGDQVSSQLALGSQLDPVTARQVEQQTRMGQAARGNVYGTPQMVQEAMTTGQAGQALQQQRQQAAINYLSSGQTLGDVGMNLYNTQQANLRANQQGALSYLGSGQTPYQAGASYLNAAEQAAANASQGGPVYNPTSLGQSYTGTAAQAPQYGLDVGQQAQNWYNSLSAYTGAGAPTKNRGAAAGAGAASGALSGAIGGATVGSAVPVVGTAIGALGGAVIGGVAGGASGYYS